MKKIEELEQIFSQIDGFEVTIIFINNCIIYS